MFMENFFEELAKTVIFKGLNLQDIEGLLKDKIFRINKYNKDEYIAYNDDICNNLLILLEGSVRGDMTDFSGKTIKIEDIKAPGPIASAFIFGRNNKFPVDVIANEHTTVLILPKESLIRIITQDERVLKNFLNIISTRAQFLSSKIKFLSFKTIKGKIAHYILELSGKNEQHVILPKTQTELAEFFGVTRPSLARAILEMERDGIIIADRKKIVIKDRKKLTEYLR